MTIDRLYQCDPAGPASNSNFAGIPLGENAMAPSHVNNAFRQLGLMLAHELHLPAVSLSASVSTNVVTSSIGPICTILGAGAVNSLGIIPGEMPSASVLRFLEFSSSASLSHGPALRLIGGASRKTQPGDISGFLHVGSGDSWIELFASRADGTPQTNSMSVTTITNRSLSTSAISTVTLNAASISATNIALTSLSSMSASVGDFTLLRVGGHGVMTNVVADTEATYTTLGTILPIDDTIPQNTEGVEILSVAITPLNASSTLEIDFNGSFGGSSNRVLAALFVDTTANALNVVGDIITNTGQHITLTMKHRVTAGSTSARTYKIRAGSDIATDAFLNGDSGGRHFGGVSTAVLTVREILPQ